MAGSFRSFRRVRTDRKLELEFLEPRDVPATITVTNLNDTLNTGDGISIREALNSINAGAAANADVSFTGTFGTSDTVLFAAGVTGTINTSSQLSITKPVTVTGPGSATLALVNTAAASATSRVLGVAPTTAGGIVNVSGLRISGGNATAVGSGILNTFADLRLTGVEVSGNTTSSTTGGGGIYLTSSSSSKLTLTNSVVKNNSAPASAADGGGIYVRGASPVALTNSTVSGNVSGDDGAGLYFWAGGSLTVDNSTISGNTAGTGGIGGGVYLYGVNTTIRNSTIANNSAGVGGGIGIPSYNSSTTISNSTISGNTATSAGFYSAGGITNFGIGSLTLTSTIVAKNSGGASAGNADLGLYTGTVTANNSLIGVKPAGVTISGTANKTGTSAAPLDPRLGALADNSGTTQTMALLTGSPAIDAGSGTSPDQRGFGPIGIRDIGAFEFTPPPSSPTISSANTITFTAGTFGSFTVTTTGFPIASITRSGVLPSGVGFVNNGNGTATISGTPALGTGGTYSLVLTAANGLPPNATQNFTLKVNQKPAFTSPNSATFTAGVASSVTITTSGFPAAVISSLSNLPSGLSLVDNGNGTAKITGAASISGTYTINLTAVNGILPDALQTFTLKVVLPPSFVSTDSTTFTAGTFGSFTITALGSPLPLLSMSGGSLPSGVSFKYIGNGIATLSGTPTQAGSFPIQFTASSSVNPDAIQNFTLTVVLPPPPPVSPPPPASPPPPPASPPPPPPVVNQPKPLPSHPTPVVLVASPGSGPDGSEVRVLDISTFQVVKTFTPFPGFYGNVSTAAAELTGDGVMDYVVAAGFGGGPHVKVIDGQSGAVVQSFYAYAPYFNGGVSVATGDVNGDGRADVITGAGAGGGPHVKVFDGETFSVIRSFYAYDANFHGGVNVGAADLDGDGRAEIVTGAAAGGGPHVKAFDGSTLSELLSFYAFDPSFTGGVSVAGADLSGNGRDQILVGAGTGNAPQVKAFDAAGVEMFSFLAYDPSFTGGVSVAGADLNADGRDEIVTGAGFGGGPHVKAFDSLTQTEKFSVFAGDGLFRGGVTVG